MATERAIGAIERANEYRDAGVLIFEPRLLDAEKAADEIPTRQISQEARNCVSELGIYRKWIELADRWNDSVRGGDKSADAHLENAISQGTDSGIRLNVCIGKLRASYLE